MNPQAVIDLGVEAVLVAMKVSAPALVATMVIGLLISILQAATQINEQTMSFIPKVLAMTAAMVFTGPWILQTMIFFTRTIFLRITNVTN
jgi:flagellar biosynthetic protein FliQ